MVEKLVRLGIFPMATQFQPGHEGVEDQEWAKTLENLVKILSGYGKLRFVPFYVLKKHGETEENTPRRWRAVLGLEEIQYLPEDVNDPVRDVGLGRAAHEVWHVVFSRPELIFDEPELSKSMAFQALWWAIEDPRVNWLGLRKHPGARDWVNAALARDFANVDDPAEIKRFREETPIHIQFTNALIFEWFGARPDPRVADPRVREALAKAYPAIRRAYFEPDAARSFEIVKNEVWPIYKELVDEAYDDAMKQEGADGQDQDGQESDQDQDGDGQQSGKSGEQSKKQKAKEDAAKRAKEKMEKAEKEFRDKHASKVVDSPEKMDQAARDKAKKEMEKLRKKMGQKQDGQKQQGQKQDGQQADSDSDGEGDEADGQPQDAEHRAKQRERLSKAERNELKNDEEYETAQGSYDDYRKRVQQHVPIMRSQFEQILKRKIRRRVIRNRDSGDFDTDALSRIPSGDRDVFKESMIANKTLYRISLLIDISGSMNGDKKERAIEGAVMMMEALDKLPGVQYEIVAFDDKPYVVKAYNERSTSKVKAEILRSLLKNGGSTQSGLAIKEALERMRMSRGDRLMIMVNDGDPDNNFSKQEFQAMVRAAKDVDIHGVGLGSDAQLVLDLFPAGRGWWLKDPAEFARRLRAILATKIK